MRGGPTRVCVCGLEKLKAVNEGGGGGGGV